MDRFLYLSCLLPIFLLMSAQQNRDYEDEIKASKMEITHLRDYLELSTRTARLEATQKQNLSHDK